VTEPTSELLELATPYALHAVGEPERAAIDRQVAAAAAPVADAFRDEVRAVRETMAIVSVLTAAEPPARLRPAVLAAAESDTGRGPRWRAVAFAAAAAIVVGLASFGAGIALRPPAAAPTVVEQVLAAPDVRTVSRLLTDGGTATVMFSRDRDAGVLVMNNVRPPASGTVYQMWLLGDNGPVSAGTMSAAAVAPSTTAVLANLATASALAFTVEPGNGSPQPTGQVFAELPLT
jgi:anti-sigma-K factor RskA